MSYMKSRLMSALCVALTCIPISQAIASGAVEVIPGDCATGIQLKARGARLSEILNRLSLNLGFQLHYRAETNPTMNIDFTGTPAELVDHLLSDRNIIVSTVPDPFCPDSIKVTQIRVLPAGTPDRSSAELARERERASKKGLETYLNAHGINPTDSGDAVVKGAK